jgi:hypothetical protein
MATQAIHHWHLDIDLASAVRGALWIAAHALFWVMLVMMPSDQASSWT